MRRVFAFAMVLLMVLQAGALGAAPEQEGTVPVETGPPVVEETTLPQETVPVQTVPPVVEETTLPQETAPVETVPPAGEETTLPQETVPVETTLPAPEETEAPAPAAPPAQSAAAQESARASSNHVVRVELPSNDFLAVMELGSDIKSAYMPTYARCYLEGQPYTYVWGQIMWYYSDVDVRTPGFHDVMGLVFSPWGYTMDRENRTVWQRLLIVDPEAVGCVSVIQASTVSFIVPRGTDEAARAAFQRRYAIDNTGLAALKTLVERNYGTSDIITGYFYVQDDRDDVYKFEYYAPYDINLVDMETVGSYEMVEPLPPYFTYTESARQNVMIHVMEPDEVDLRGWRIDGFGTITIPWLHQVTSPELWTSVDGGAWMSAEALLETGYCTESEWMEHMFTRDYNTGMAYQVQIVESLLETGHTYEFEVRYEGGKKSVNSFILDLTNGYHPGYGNGGGSRGGSDREEIDPIPTDPVPTAPVPTDPIPTDPLPTAPVPPGGGTAGSVSPGRADGDPAEAPAVPLGREEPPAPGPAHPGDRSATRTSWMSQLALFRVSPPDLTAWRSHQDPTGSAPPAPEAPLPGDRAVDGVASVETALPSQRATGQASEEASGAAPPSVPAAPPEERRVQPPVLGTDAQPTPTQRPQARQVGPPTGESPGAELPDQPLPVGAAPEAPVPGGDAEAPGAAPVRGTASVVLVGAVSALAAAAVWMLLGKRLVKPR